MLKNLQYCYSVLSFLRPHYSIMLSFFINFFLSLFRVCLPKPLLSLLLCHTISPKLLPLPLTNSFTTKIFLLFISSFSLSLVLSVPLSFWCLSLRQALHSSPKHAIVVILQTQKLSLRHHHRCYLHSHCPIRIQFLHHPISLRSLHSLHTHMPPLISALSPYPYAAFDLVLSVHSFPFHCLSCALSPLLLTPSFIFSLPLCFPFSLHLDFMGLRCGGVAKMRCWVWLGCSGFSWIVGLYSGLWWVSVMVR